MTKKFFPFGKTTIIKQLPEIINKIYQIYSDLSCDNEESGIVKSNYETVLKDSGHFSSMSFNNSNTQMLEEIGTKTLYGSSHHIAKK